MSKSDQGQYFHRYGFQSRVNLPDAFAVNQEVTVVLGLIETVKLSITSIRLEEGNGRSEVS